MTRADSPRASMSISRLGDAGWREGVTWATHDRAWDLADRIGGHGEVVANPHLAVADINSLVRGPAIVSAVADVIGPDIAIEGGFLLSKKPGADFPVPWHQDGISDRGELDPARAVTLWAALTDATVEAGVPGSWKHGYLPYRREPAGGDQRGRALMTDVPDASPSPVFVPVTAGQALLMDVRLLHRSGSNTAGWLRIGLNIRYVAPGAVHTRGGQPTPTLTPIAGAGW